MVLAQLVIHLEEYKIGPISLNIVKNKLRQIKNKCGGGAARILDMNLRVRVAHGWLGPWVPESFKYSG